MKKITAIIAIMMFALSSEAQTVKVLNSLTHLKGMKLDVAKEEIDAACLHEETKDSALTWYYRVLIYVRIGEDSKVSKPLFPDLAPDWMEQACSAAIRCRSLDTKQEYAKQLNVVFGNMGTEYYNLAVKSYNARDYAKAIEMADKSVECFNNSGEIHLATQSMFVAGRCCEAKDDTENAVSYYKQMISNKTDNNYPYSYLFNLYKDRGDNAHALEVASSYAANCANDYRAFMLLADYYRIDNNMSQCNEQINTALALAKKSKDTYHQVLVLSGDLLAKGGDNEGAIAKYNESIKAKSKQFEAYYALGCLIFNQAVEKNNAAIDMKPSDDEMVGQVVKLQEEAKQLFLSAIPHLEKALAYIDGLDDQKSKDAMSAKQIDILSSLQTSYKKVDNISKYNAVKYRLDQMIGN